MALGNTMEDNPSDEGIARKVLNISGGNDDTEEEARQEQAPPGICDICSDFYHFLVSGKL